MNRCIDAGRTGCPCTLAESGDCIICSKLNGGSCEDCVWQGSCVYTLFQQNGQRPADVRQSRLMDIVEIREYGPKFKVFVLHADRGFCQAASFAGAYVFVRDEADARWFDVPISILKSEPDKGLIHLGICACGPKTTKLLTQTTRLSVRGIYHNGLSGLSGLYESPDAAVVFAKGIAVAPLRNFLDGGKRYTDYLKNLHLYVDLEKVGFDFFKDYFGDLPVASIKVCSFAETGLPLFSEGALRADTEPRINIFALTSPYYAEQIVSAAGSYANIVRPAAGNFCCGEGICGACTCSDSKGNTIRRCKFAE